MADIAPLRQIRAVLTRIDTDAAVAATSTTSSSTAAAAAAAGRSRAQTLPPRKENLFFFSFCQS